ncbi:MAG: hypothetical protein IPK50_23445 [Fibrobacterota bacterium]|nr:hypothetical protein [Fibrobacterota bacterium]QQS05189.1 MAG: hypothetical protein IPK50_23445 [Fibrobacterota bacterium]
MHLSSVIALLLSLTLASQPDSTAETLENLPSDEPGPGHIAPRTKAIYFHPTSMLISASMDIAQQIPVTLELELEGSGSIAFQPLLIAGSVTQGKAVHGEMPPKTRVIGGQLLASYRIYPVGTRHEGFFAAPAVGGVYVNLHRPRETTGRILWYERQASTKGFLAGAHIGSRNLWGRVVSYSDIGGIYSNLSFSGDDIDAGRRNGFDLDMNFGIGFSF